MATIFNEQRVLGVRVVADGTLMHNGLPVFGVRDTTPGLLFTDNFRTLGVDVLGADTAMHNEQPVRGVVLIGDGRDMYNNRPVIPAIAVSGSLNPLEPGAAALIARFTVPPTSQRSEDINDVFIGLEAAGLLTGKLDFLYLAGADAQASTRNWIADAFNLTAVGTGTPAFAADRGFTGSGINGYSTNFNPNTAGGLFALNSAHMSVWCRTNSQSASAISMGARTSGTTEQTIMVLRNTSDQALVRVNQDVATGTFAATDSTGHFLANRSAAAAKQLYRNGVLVGSDAAASTGVPEFPIYICGNNNAGSFASGDVRQIFGASGGASLSDVEVAALHTVLDAYRVAVGA